MADLNHIAALLSTMCETKPLPPEGPDMTTTCVFRDDRCIFCGASIAVNVPWGRTCPVLATRSVLDDVCAERTRQDAKWGEQNHPNGTGPQTTPVAEIVRGKGNAIVNRHFAFGLANQAKTVTDNHAKECRVTYADILLEEVFEALAEDDPARLRAELVQVAAVAVQWVEKIDRETSQQ